MLELHRKHGDVVRTGPNSLSFATLQAYQDIHSHVTKGKKRFLKTELYDNGDPDRIVGVQNPVIHSQMRRVLSHGFSAKALRDQEDIVHKYLDDFLRQLGRLGEEGRKPIDMSEAYNWATFDIIGDLSFGESFDAVAQGRSHYWISLLVEGSFYSLLFSLKRRLPWIRLVLPFLLPKGMAEKSEKRRELSRHKSQRRIELSNSMSRDDFFAHMLAKGNMTEGELASQATTLIVAGSETTATFLTGVTWYPLKNPDCLSRLRAEVDSAFTSIDQITGDSVAHLEYLHGVIEEGLRIFPPVVFGLPRYSPGAVIDGHYIPAGVTVATENYCMAYDTRYWHNPESFRPERWIGEGLGDEKKASQPFSMGPRACLGINLAYLEMRLILAKIVFSYDLELVSREIEDWNQACQLWLLWKKPELLVKFHPRNRDHVATVESCT
ncbi:cytochrome P450 [Pseudomassariella vexata]|uniref:Cytochrome P450 n=1 Tax=Pseudomassariella vexata TaxID=1141098 RepID=A0A1Y2DRI6_9PEZI|nr:cytochrome P450 [Pseudomassariella vexata]ORY61754.1 cytochrome P450 [Pseudomassariella vexata]